MDILPPPDQYIKEFSYLPWIRVINMVIDHISAHSNDSSSVLDLMCGPGYLLNQLYAKKSSLKLFGVDIKSEYIDFAEANFPYIDFLEQDVLTFRPAKKYDFVVCTGGLHHLLQEDKQEFILNVLPNLISNNGQVLLADPYISSYSSESQRVGKVMQLGLSYLFEVADLSLDANNLATTLDILRSDLLGYEFKTDLESVLNICNATFGTVKVFKTWPTFTELNRLNSIFQNLPFGQLDKEDSFGDYLLVLSNPK